MSFNNHWRRKQLGLAAVAQPDISLGLYLETNKFWEDGCLLGCSAV
jgi:hypothetical protein